MFINHNYLHADSERMFFLFASEKVVKTKEKRKLLHDPYKIGRNEKLTEGVHTHDIPSQQKEGDKIARSTYFSLHPPFLHVQK